MMEARPFLTATAIKVTFLIVTTFFLLIPLGNDLLSVFPERAPSGMGMAKPARDFSKSAFMKRAWQKSLEARAKRSSGLWYPLTLCANEIYSRAFGQISAFNSGSVRLGKEGHLFQTAHLAAINHRPPRNRKKLPQRVADIKELQERLRARGKTLLIVVTPNLATLYPQLIPSGFMEPGRFKRPHPYEAVKKAFDDNGIAYVDTVETLRAAQQVMPFRFFAPTASHWNDVGSCLALKAINDKLKDLGGRSFRSFSCDNYLLEPQPRAKDRDLLEIANLLFPERLFQATPYVNISYQEPAPANQPSTLLVGTSYLFALSEHLYDWDLAKQHRLFFYFRSWRNGGERSFHPLPRKKLDWNAILSSDIIIVNVGVGNPVTIGYGFIEAALLALKQSEDEPGTRAQRREPSIVQATKQQQ